MIALPKSARSRPLLASFSIAALLSACSAATTAQVVPVQASQPPRLTTAPTAAPARGDVQSRLLAAHNRHRAVAGVPPLRWDPNLAADAARYAAELPGMGHLTHSARGSRPGQRENLWMGPAGVYSPEAMVDNWAEEKKWFRPGTFPDVSATGDWIDVSHYTQMIWSTTTDVGCGLARGGGRDWLVCRYTPPGNIDGRRVP